MTGRRQVASPEGFVQVKDLRFRFDPKKIFFQNLNFTWKRGTITALLGPNGCGKSTLASLLAGRLRPDSGAVRVMPSRGNGIRLVPAETSLYLPFSIAETIDIHARFQLPGYADRCRRSLAAIGAPADDSRLLHSLSSGERRKVYLALALASGCDYLILDEPDAHLDFGSALELLSTLTGETGRGILLITHQFNLALKFASEFLLLDENHNLVYQGSRGPGLHRALKKIFPGPWRFAGGAKGFAVPQ